MRKVTLCLLLVVLGLSLFSMASDARTISGQTQAQKQSKKNWKKASKQQAKAQKKQQKANKKAAKKWNKNHPTRSTTT